MKKILTVITLILLIIGAAFSIQYETKKYLTLDFTPFIKEVSQNTKLIDTNLDHNQALDVIEYANKKGFKTPPILINFDTHSDIFVNTDRKKGQASDIGDWINELLAKQPEIEELYWVMPYEAANNLDLKFLFADNDLEVMEEHEEVLFGNSTNTKIKTTHFVFNPLTKKAYTQELLIDPDTYKINENSEDKELINRLFKKDISKLRKVKLITCTEKTLPDFKDKQVFLSIDADYISNSGHDTTMDFEIRKDRAAINATFYSIFKTLKEKNVKPEIISLSISPQYLPEEHHAFVNTIFNYIVRTSGKTDEISTYKNKYLNLAEY